MAGRGSDVFFGMPGVWFQERADDPGTAINIRGLQDFGRVDVVIDGARQNFQRTGHNADGVFYLEPEMLAGVDVVRGPVANIYGSGAIGGVVSFRTKDVEDMLKPGQRWGVLARARSARTSCAASVRHSPPRASNPKSDMMFGGRHLPCATNYRDGDGNIVPNTAYNVTHRHRQGDGASGRGPSGQVRLHRLRTRPTSPASRLSARHVTGLRSSIYATGTRNEHRDRALDLLASGRSICSISTATSTGPGPAPTRPRSPAPAIFGVGDSSAISATSPSTPTASTPTTRRASRPGRCNTL